LLRTKIRQKTLSLRARGVLICLNLYSSAARPLSKRRGLDLAIAHGWLVLHEGGTYVQLTDVGAVLFA
jgi:hypothetical protein